MVSKHIILLNIETATTILSVQSSKWSNERTPNSTANPNYYFQSMKWMAHWDLMDYSHLFSFFEPCQHCQHHHVRKRQVDRFSALLLARSDIEIIVFWEPNKDCTNKYTSTCHVIPNETKRKVRCISSKNKKIEWPTRRYLNFKLNNNRNWFCLSKTF